MDEPIKMVFQYLLSQFDAIANRAPQNENDLLELSMDLNRVLNEYRDLVCLANAALTFSED